MEQGIGADALPGWRETPAKQAVLDFVHAVTAPDSPDFVAEPDRIAVFDNDGTLWTEQPVYFQGLFAFDRITVMAQQHPEWRTTQPFKAVLDGDVQALAASGEKGIAEIVAVTHSGMTTEEFSRIVRDWLATARHPRFKRPYTDLIYQPMLELLAYLRANGFKTFIVSGGGIEFMRPWTETIYGIPPEQVVGSSAVTKYQTSADDKPVLMKEARVEFIDDGPGKPAGINRFISYADMYKSFRTVFNGPCRFSCVPAVCSQAMQNLKTTASTVRRLAPSLADLSRCYVRYRTALGINPN